MRRPSMVSPNAFIVKTDFFVLLNTKVYNFKTNDSSYSSYNQSYNNDTNNNNGKYMPVSEKFNNVVNKKVSIFVSLVISYTKRANLMETCDLIGELVLEQLRTQSKYGATKSCPLLPRIMRPFDLTSCLRRIS